MKKKKKHIVLRILSLILWIACMSCVCYLSYQIYKANMLPNKYYYILIGVIVFLILIFIMFILNKKSKVWILIICDILFLTLSIVLYFANIKINETLKFLDQNLNAKYETNIYNIVVSKESEIKSIKDLDSKTIKLVNDLGDKTLLETSIKRSTKCWRTCINKRKNKRSNIRNR